MEFNPNEYKTTEIKFKSEEEKNKFFVTVIVLVLLVILVAFVFTNKTNTQEANADDNIKVPNPEVQVEMTLVFRNIGTTVEDFATKTYHLQFAFIINENENCLMGLKKTRDLFQAGFKSEALVEYANVVHTVLNEKNQCKRSFFNAIEIAHTQGIIDQPQKNFLHQLRILRNKKAHTPGLNLDKEITDLYLNSEINHIDQLFLC